MLGLMKWVSGSIISIKRKMPAALQTNPRYLSSSSHFFLNIYLLISLAHESVKGKMN